MDEFIEELEKKFGVKLNHERCKQAYLDGYMTTLQFEFEQSGRELTEDEVQIVESSLKERLDLD